MTAGARFLRRTIGLLIFTFSSGMFLWGVWPFPQLTESIPLQHGHRLVLAWPPTARIGDSHSIRIQLEPYSSAQKEASSSGLLPGEANSNVMAEARLEFAGLQFYPGEMASQSLQPGKPLTFHWQFRPEARGDFNGVAWLYIHEVPRDGRPESVTPVSAREMRIKTVDLFGFNGPAARLLGGTGMLVGGLLGLDGVFARLRNRTRRQDAPQTAPEFVEQ